MYLFRTKPELVLMQRQARGALATENGAPAPADMSGTPEDADIVF